MKKLLLLLSLSCIGQIQGQTWQWAESARGTNVNEGTSAAIDTAGNLFVTGYFQNPFIIFGTYTLTCSGFLNVFVAKYDDNGNVLWAKAAGGTAGSNSGSAVSADVAGNLFVTGGFQSHIITFGTYTLTNAGTNYNVFLSKYDVNGNVLWAKAAGGTNDDFGNSVSTDAIGNVFVTGSFSSPIVTFGTYTLTNASGGTSSNVFIAKYDASGNVLWAKSVGGTNSDQGYSVSADATGNVFVTGSFSSPTITIGSYTLTNSGNADVFIAKYDSSGNVLWAKNVGGTNNDIGYSLSADATGNVFVTGGFRSPTVTFGTNTLTNAGTNSNVFIVKYDTSGNVLWAKSAGGIGTSSNGDIGYSISTNVTGNAFVTGGFYSPAIIFGIDTLTAPTNSNDPMFIVKYDANGNVLCASALASGGDDQCGVSADRFDNAYIAGDFYITPFVVGSTTLTLSGTEDVFVAKYICSLGNNIDELTKDQEIYFYPNPTSDQFFIETNTTDKLIVDLYDVNGRHVFSANVSDKSNINVTTLDDGVYSMIVRSVDRVTNKKLVILR